MNAIRKTDDAELANLGVVEQAEGLGVGVYEIFDGDDGYELIDTGMLSVNCRCLVVARSLADAQKLIDECDPAGSVCDETHLWLPTADAD